MFDVMAHRGMLIDNTCCICHKEEDCFKLVFALCDFSQVAWHLFQPEFLTDEIFKLTV